MFMKKVVLITGASRGLGRNLALQASKENYQVYGGVRKVEDLKENITPIFLDLTNPASLEEGVNRILEKEGKIDCLVHNAGIAYYCPVDGMTQEEVETLFQVNVFGPLRLTQLVLPSMRKENGGRIVFISSVRSIEPIPYMGVYSGSKAAIESIAFDWAASLKKWNISVSVVQPGPIDTGVHLFHGSYFNEKRKNPYLPYPEGSVNWQPVEEIAKSIVEHLEDPTPPFRFQPDQISKTAIPKHVTDASGNEWLSMQQT